MKSNIVTRVHKGIKAILNSVRRYMNLRKIQKEYLISVRKREKYVRCIDANTTYSTRLTKGKIYKVLYIIGSLYKIKDDCKNYDTLYSERFIDVPILNVYVERYKNIVPAEELIELLTRGK